jgi:hypothetical protein
MPRMRPWVIRKCTPQRRCRSSWPSGTLFLALALLGAAPSPAPSPSPAAGTVSIEVDAHTTFISESTRGPGIAPPEGPGFAAGSPFSPLTPYDVFSSAPLTPGNAAESSAYFTPRYEGASFRASLTFGAGYVTGSTTSAAYWGEPLFPTLNPHLGAQLLPYRIVFPTHPGQDDGTAFVASIVSGSIASRDGNAALQAGWFNLHQSDSFVFTQPAVTNVSPEIAFATPESLGGGPPNLDWWQSQTAIPLHGVDAFFKRGIATVELTDATLPSLPDTSARMEMASLAIDRGEGTRYSAQVLHVVTGGKPLSETVLYGANPQIFVTPQGWLPVSTIGGQRQWIFGARAAFHVSSSIDGVAEYGHSTYGAGNVPGNYYHIGGTKNVRGASFGADVYRNEPYYAQTLLPYGVPENQWSIAWSWPGQWLKSNYQLINNFPVNIDRQGYRLSYALHGGSLELKAMWGQFAQIAPITISNALRPGFVDGFFLPQLDANATLGRQQQYALWTAWHGRLGNLTLDYVNDAMRRPAAIGASQDFVNYDAPEYVIALSRNLGAATLGSISYGRYAMRGSFAATSTNVDFAQRMFVAGLELQESRSTAALVSVRWAGFSGAPSIPLGPSPAWSGTLFVFEERLHT